LVHFVGAGPGAPDLITLRGAELLAKADVVIYAGSLVNPALLERCKPDCRIHNSAELTLEQVLSLMEEAERRGEDTVRLHTGDPCLYGAVREQMDALEQRGISFDDTPGVSSFCAAAAALKCEYTLPGVSQSLILTRIGGRTPVPEQLSALAAHQTSMVLFLSAGMLEQVQRELLKGGYAPETPAALVYKASWPEEKTVLCTVGTLAQSGQSSGICRTALVLVGDFLRGEYTRSMLYHPGFTTGYREGQV
jgi:precorrin-4/cobalt-precorrin-4 C11-methyltransferase